MFSHALKCNIQWDKEVPINSNPEENIVTVSRQEGQDHFGELYKSNQAIFKLCIWTSVSTKCRAQLQTGFQKGFMGLEPLF